MGKINAYDTIVTEDQKREKLWKSRKDCFGMEFTAY